MGTYLGCYLLKHAHILETRTPQQRVTVAGLPAKRFKGLLPPPKPHFHLRSQLRRGFVPKPPSMVYKRAHHRLNEGVEHLAFTAETHIGRGRL